MQQRRQQLARLRREDVADEIQRLIGGVRRGRVAHSYIAICGEPEARALLWRRAEHLSERRERRA